MHAFTPEYLHYLGIMGGRALFIFLYLVALFRLLGKRQAGQLNIFDLAAIMGVANAVQNGITMGSGNLSVGIVAVLVLLVTGRLCSWIVVRQPGLEPALAGSPALLIDKGVLQTNTMRLELVSRTQLLATLRTHGLVSISQVNTAVLEIDGSISIVPQITEDAHPQRPDGGV